MQKTRLNFTLARSKVLNLYAAGRKHLPTTTRNLL